MKALKNLSLSSSSASSLSPDTTLKKIDMLLKLRTERTPAIIDFLTFLHDFRHKMKNYVSQKSAWIQYLIKAVDRVGRREIKARWESVKGLGDEEGFNRMVEYLSMRLFGDGYWWEFEAEAEKEGKQKVGEGVKIFIEKVRIFAEKRWIAAHDLNPLYFSTLYLAMTVATPRNYHYSAASQNISQQTSPTQVTWTTQTNLRFTYVNLT